MIQPADGLGAGPAEVVAATDQQRQRATRALSTVNLPQTLGAQLGHVTLCVSARVGLAALAGGEPRTRRSFAGRSMSLTIDDQALGDVPADTVAAPMKHRRSEHLPAEGEHGLIAVH